MLYYAYTYTSVSMIYFNFRLEYIFPAAPSAPPAPQVLHGSDVTSSTITIYLTSSPDNNGRVV